MPSLACTPAPSCWLTEGKDYLRTMCQQEAQKGTQIAEFKRIEKAENDIGGAMKFVSACCKIGIKLH